MKRFLVILFFVFLSLSCFAQGTTAGRFTVFPEESSKDSLILCGRTVNIKGYFNITNTLDLQKNSNSENETVIIFHYELGLYSREHSEDDVSMYADNKKLKPFQTKTDDHSYIDFYYKFKLPKGQFKLSYSMDDDGSSLGGPDTCYIKRTDEEKWILSDKYEEKIYISITNSYVEVENGTFTILGTGKKDGNTFFLKSGSLFSTTKKDLGITIKCSSLNNAHSGGSGLPVLPYDAKKIRSATEYIYESTTGARIIEYELIGDYDHAPFEELIELLKEMDKNQLRLLRNSFYAKNGYVFKDENLNKYFSSAICYFPDKSMTIDKIKVTESEKIVIEMIQAAEQGESPEAVFNKYKK
jgi:hypothetical protein